MVTVGTIEQIKEKIAKKNSNFKKKLQNRPLNVSHVTNDFGETLTRVDGEIPTELKINKSRRFDRSKKKNYRYYSNINWSSNPIATIWNLQSMRFLSLEPFYNN